MVNKNRLPQSRIENTVSETEALCLIHDLLSQVRKLALKNKLSFIAWLAGVTALECSQTIARNRYHHSVEQIE
jgi:hypothetical protein